MVLSKINNSKCWQTSTVIFKVQIKLLNIPTPRRLLKIWSAQTMFCIKSVCVNHTETKRKFLTKKRIRFDDLGEINVTDPVNAIYGPCSSTRITKCEMATWPCHRWLWQHLPFETGSGHLHIHGPWISINLNGLFKYNVFLD